MRQQESVPVPWSWTRGAAWKGAGASLLLHLFVGAAMIVALSGPPKGPPQVIDLTLLPPAGIAGRPVPPAFITSVIPSRVPGTAVLPNPPSLPAAQPVANPPEATAPSSPSAAAIPGAPAPGSPHALDATPVSTGKGPIMAAAAGPSGISGAGPPPMLSGAMTLAGIPGAGPPAGISGAGTPATNFTWIRDAIQHAITYPATARRMGWEGKVVVAFQLLSDGSVRDVRIVQGSGHAALDRGAIDAVRNASPFPRSPVEAEVITPVVYRLTTR